MRGDAVPSDATRSWRGWAVSLPMSGANATGHENTKKSAKEPMYTADRNEKKTKDDEGTRDVSTRLGRASAANYV